ncbi:MAG: bifunctional serine/threonine-protein kinase/formylglycine-generating enzyme family protein [Phycisphaerae bacterium]|nr:bifunctional serine/threonine-protein kinase/formylglycine-generating enzyme family protein [Phycisphaerae bacterium]
MTVQGTIADVNDGFDEKAVFLEAVVLEGAALETLLARRCPDQQSRERVERLLRRHAGAGETPFRAAASELRATGGGDPASCDGLTSLAGMRIIERIGAGGMGVVYRAVDPVLGRDVAIKVLADHLAGSEQALARFRREARAAAALHHPVIVPVYAFGEDEGKQYIVSEFVHGTTLAVELDAERERRGASSVDDVRAWHRRAGDIVAAIADGLDDCHRAGIVHRDVKPSNILIDPIRGPRLTDFGIARDLGEAGPTRLITSVIGSAHYMSPEQASVALLEVDGRSDVFSLGVVLYELLALRRPFEGSDSEQVLRAVVSEDPKKLRAVEPLVFPDLETICHKALEKDPALRYQTAAHMAADLRCVAARRPILARPPSIGRRIKRWTAHHRRAVAFAAASLLLIVTAVTAAAALRARAAAYAWLSVSADVEHCSVYLQRCDEATCDLDTSRLIGTTPIEFMPLEIGQYRVTILAPDGKRFAECNAVLLRSGYEAALAFHATESDVTTDAAILVSAQKVSADMAMIDGGEYIIGDKDESSAPARRRTVTLAPFLIDRQEVSRGEFEEFLTTTGRAPPRGWATYPFDASMSARPATLIAPEDAEAYARWRGKRLPTHAEWQAATRGPTGRRYPWTDAEMPAGMAKLDPSGESLLAAQDTRPREQLALAMRSIVDVHAPDPLQGILPVRHAFGNVRELTGSVDQRFAAWIVLGRCWQDSLQHRDLSYVLVAPSASGDLSLGFRCAKSLEPPAGGPAPKER